MPTTNEELERVTKEIHDELDKQRAECARKVRKIMDGGEEIDPSVADLDLGGAAARFTKKPNVAKTSEKPSFFARYFLCCCKKAKEDPKAFHSLDDAPRARRY